MRLFTLAAVVGAGLGLAASAQASSQFVVNGDFTQLSNGVGQFDTNTTVTGWSANGGYDFVMAQADVGVSGQHGALSLWDATNSSGGNTWNGAAAGAGNFAALDGDFHSGPISQTVTGLTIGDTYRLTYDYAFSQQEGFNGATVQSVTSSFGGNTVNTANDNLPNHGFSGWLVWSGKVVATSTSEVLSFSTSSTPAVPPFALVSNVSMTSVPEPTTWMMMLVGVCGLGGLARRRRALSAVAA